MINNIKLNFFFLKKYCQFPTKNVEPLYEISGWIYLKIMKVEVRKDFKLMYGNQ